MAAYYTQYHMEPAFSYPLMVADWNPGTILSSPMYTPQLQPLSVAVLSPNQICPYTGTLVTDIAIPILPDSSQVLTPAYTPDVSPIIYTEIHNLYQPREDGVDPVEYYLFLPKDMFPNARMLALDPNPIIDEFCKIANMNDNAPWILDLEFGIPRMPITRSIPIYDVKINSIQCKNAPNAIHPGFESCDQDFRKVILFYYDCIISAWYRGFILLTCDKSVENFQNWISLPMQFLGMCWP